MTSPPSSSENASSAFFLLDERIQRWIWDAGWSELREVQERAIPPILTGDLDVIVAAATASGKTEAAFLPILSSLLSDDAAGSCVLYVSPLKALINDQWGRLERLCDAIEIPVFPWHGDISGGRKKEFLKSRNGILLITPESLESLFVNRGHSIAGIFAFLRYVVIDELHAFLGNERGKQLQSLLNRLDLVLDRKPPRIGLSATLGDMSLAADYLRPGKGSAVKVVVSADENAELKLLVKGYANTPPRVSPDNAAQMEHEGRVLELEDQTDGGPLAISGQLFKTLRGSNNLIFPNSRGQVELYADLLRRQCEQLGVPNEFWPHHGSLSKDIREQTEAALKKGERPASAVCTTTLELGIDIGTVKSVAQIGPPPSVASLRQRLGRSGRRGDPAILRAYIIEEEYRADLPFADRLRAELVQTIAMVRLLLRGWYEPPDLQGWHLSTLIQQLLSVIAQYGGVLPLDAWRILCETGPFRSVPKSAFVRLLRALHEGDVLMQEDDGLLLHGAVGERIVNHHTFYAAFSTEEEFRLIFGGKTLGTLPTSRPLSEGTYIIFAGRRWKIIAVDVQSKTIEVMPAGGGRPPRFDGGYGRVDDEVRREMQIVYKEADSPAYLDETARMLLKQGRDTYDRLDLAADPIIVAGADCHLFAWRGDRIQDTLALMLRSRGLEAVNEGLSIWVRNSVQTAVEQQLRELLDGPPPDALELAGRVKTMHRAKWDTLLPPDLLEGDFVSQSLDVPGALGAITRLLH